MYLLDTNVLSELRKLATGKADLNVKLWAESADPETLFVSVITLLELETGMLLIARRDRHQGEVLRSWLQDYLLPAFSNRILMVDLGIARRCAALSIPDPRPRRDSLIAATALVHRLTVVTRNVSDFTPSGVPVVNPWEHVS
jgi:predicted nucleic acid-binding protein